MNSTEDPLSELPLEKWGDLQNELLKDWPRSIAGYWWLGTQREWRQRGLKYDFHMYCPYGDVRNGMVVIQTKGSIRELIVQCASDDTTLLEEALRKTKRINWNKNYTVPCPPTNIVRCINAILNDVKMTIRKLGTPHYMMLLGKEAPIFEDIRLPEGVSIKLLTEEHVDVVDSTWVNRYKGSDWYFRLLINGQYGYGLFKDNQLASFIFINEFGFLTHLFTLESFRKNGYAEMLLKSVCNVLITEKKDTYFFVMEGNDIAHKLYYKLGFKKYHVVLWQFLTPETSKL